MTATAPASNLMRTAVPTFDDLPDGALVIDREGRVQQANLAFLALIFEQFFTTKEVGKGTGQGLALARKIIVDGHGGTLGFASEAGKGTTFTLRLPIDGQTRL